VGKLSQGTSGSTGGERQQPLAAPGRAERGDTQQAASGATGVQERTFVTPTDDAQAQAAGQAGDDRQRRLEEMDMMVTVKMAQGEAGAHGPFGLGGQLSGSLGRIEPAAGSERQPAAERMERPPVTSEEPSPAADGRAGGGLVQAKIGPDAAGPAASSKPGELTMSEARTQAGVGGQDAGVDARRQAQVVGVDDEGRGVRGEGRGTRGEGRGVGAGGLIIAHRPSLIPHPSSLTPRL
jgi:hypothetical protein